MMRTIRAVAAFAVALAAGQVSAQSIGIYFDSAGAACSTGQSPLTAGTLYVLAVLGGPLAEGMSQAEFAIGGFPPGWAPVVTPNPTAAGTSGNPFSGGCTIAFSSCQTGTNGIVLLYTIPFFATSAVSNQYLTVERHPLFFGCPTLPLLKKCDGPFPTPVCVSGGQAVFNPTGAGCTIGVVPASWSTVKELFD